MIVYVFALAAILVLIENGIAISMMVRVNERLPEGRKLSWWRRDYDGKLNRVYREHFPDSILPDLENYFGYTAIALIAVFVLVSFYRGRIG